MLNGNFPLLPMFYNRPDDDVMERVIERLIDRADAVLLAGKATQSEYDEWFCYLLQWEKRFS